MRNEFKQAEKDLLASNKLHPSEEADVMLKAVKMLIAPDIVEITSYPKLYK